MRLLFVGESWQGSNARSLREALAGLGVDIQEIDEDHYIPHYEDVYLRAVNKLVRPLQVVELGRRILSATRLFQPDAVLVFKGWRVAPDVVRELRARRIPTVNYYPDLSPHGFGRRHREAVGLYDLVVSAKPFHPRLWRSLYGYSNRCVFVPHGYDPAVHHWEEPPTASQFDVVLCATWRVEYDRLLRKVANHLGPNVNVAVAGHGWPARAAPYPRHWHFRSTLLGRNYGQFLRSGKIVIAPVNGEIVIAGHRQPGDEDTSRTYELAAANCFFIHQRTDFVQTLYDERTEVPMWRGAAELVALVKRWLPDAEGRRATALRAHARAVPAYSIPSRAREVLAHVTTLLSS